MSLHPSIYNRREYDNDIPSHLLFQQRCRAHYSRAPPSSSPSSTPSKLQSYPIPAAISRESLSSLLKLLSHHYHHQAVEEQLAVPGLSRRSIPPTSTAHHQGDLAHNSASTRPSPKRIITVDIDEMLSSVKKPSPRRPSVEFHMNTRRRASQASSPGSSSGGESSSLLPSIDAITPATPEKSSTGTQSPEQSAMSPSKTPSPPPISTEKSPVSQKRLSGPGPPVTPELMCPKSPPGSSPLGSPPLSPGSTPKGLAKPISEPASKLPSAGLELHTALKRKAGGDGKYVTEDDVLDARASKRTKSAGPEKSVNKYPRFAKSRAAFEKKERKLVRFAKQTLFSSKQTDLEFFADVALASQEMPASRIQSLAETSAIVEFQLSLPDPNRISVPAGTPSQKPQPKRKTKNQLDLEVNLDRHEEWIEATKFSHEDKTNPIFYAFDGVTQYAHATESSPAKNGRGGGNAGSGIKKRRGGGGWNKGLGRGKGRGKGRGRGGRREEEEDPFEGKDSASDDHKALVKILKARQAQLRNFFREVGRQQADILDSLSLRDINKLVRRANAHKKVPEHDEVMEELEERKQDAIDFAKRQLVIETKLAQDQFAHQAELLNQQLHDRAKQIHKEHLAAAQGDLMLLNLQKAAVTDDDRTDDGSHNQDAEYFPRYHQFPESNVRGYTSQRITDERPFKAQLSTINYDDQVRREVLQSDIMEPVVRALEISNTARREAESREKTQNMMALSDEAVKQLSNIKGYLVPTRLTSQELNSYSLSVLADISEYHAQRYKDKTYRYLALPPGETFPKEHLEIEQLPGTTGPPRRAHVPFPRTPSIPNPRTHQFVFQNPGIPPNAATRQATQTTAQTTPKVQQRFPVQFVNQTIESRKAAGNAGKGGQRMLLPKV